MDIENYGFELNEIEISKAEYQKANKRVSDLLNEYTNKSGELVKDLQAFYYKHQNVLRKNR